MERHQAKRVVFTIEEVMSKRLTEALKEAGVTGFSILPVKGGSGASGEWSRAGQVGMAGGMVQVICVIKPERLDDLLASAFSVVEKHIGIVTIADVEVLRADRF
ncbi:MAG: transcriptional regulator [Pseudomonadota bacterium]